ncbi:hypothetical protein H4S02_001907 [Coemansia sp. RSA 2611]|nr:hypothetical protein IWW54_001620 [Coemansia sp. RSA 2705]KAJ2320917.1 hypothetical protein IWW52_001070 [Coemansia sp. RSA 2704]KAJ2365643.1 hypothetical protein H4S01_003129 [Coemansia sp. RSA 2610]KAJ2390356.1 hypothetical protein H4S02_001907 [Coemansia sp. RSA 2611]KAJ2737643.1 hypothetical protein H4R23_001695 [Coemansia sp. Cherry 401B]
MKRSADDIEEELRRFDGLVDDQTIVISDTSDDEQACLPYPEGTVKLTRMRGEPANGDNVTLRDVLQPAELRKALVTSFVVDMEWLLAHIREGTKLVVVKSYDPQSEPPGVQQTRGGQLTIVHPKFGRTRYPVMHSKLMLLFYPTYVRFVASSANLIDVDWSELQNMVFMQDMPLNTNRTFAETVFGTMLGQALRDLSVPEPVVEQLRHVDMSRVTVRVVTSVPSLRGGARAHAQAYGLARLAQVARELGRMDPLSTDVYCYGSSLGPLTTQYLWDFYSSALGLGPSAAAGAPRVKIGFHTDMQGAANRFGETARQCIKCRVDLARDAGFPRAALHVVEAAVARTLVHAKVVMVRTGAQHERGWVYVGSHNFTSGAWGRLNRARTGLAYVNNYEFGVVLPNVRFESVFGRDTVSWQGGRIPLPFRLKWTAYTDSDTPCST